MKSSTRTPAIPTRRFAAVLRLVLLATIATVPWQLAHALDLIVTTTDDAGPGSLRDAIETANASAVPLGIAFALPGEGVRTIALNSPLPTVTRQGLVIDGYSQPGAAPNNAEAGDDATILVHLDGSNVGAASVGIAVCAADVTIRGLSVTGFSASGIGLGVTRDSSLCPLGHADGAIITGNFIGIEPDGVTAAGNGNGVISSQNVSVRIGGFAPEDRNLVSGNTARGILFINAPTIGATIVGNLVGTDATGVSSQPGNGGDGIVAGNGAKEMFISTNRIAGNANGVSILPAADGNRVVFNEFFDNRRLAIDLVSAGDGDDGVTANDPDDGDGGANNLLNFPILEHVERDGALLHISGFYDRPASTEAQGRAFLWYANRKCDGSGHGEGEIPLGESEISFAPDDPETFSLTIFAPDPSSGATALTALAVAATGDTSEFSPCLALPLPDFIFASGFDIN